MSRSCRLYVGNLPWSVETQHLEELFAGKNATFADVKKGRDGRSRGYGIVRFATEQEAASALDVNGYEIEGRQLMCALLGPRPHTLSPEHPPVLHRVRFDRQAGAE